MFGIENPKDALQILFSLVTFAIAVAAWLRKPGEDARTALQSHITTEHAGLREKVMTIEERIRHMPTSDELAELEGTVKKVEERTAGLTEGLVQVRKQLDRIENFLLNNK